MSTVTTMPVAITIHQPVVILLRPINTIHDFSVMPHASMMQNHLKNYFHLQQHLISIILVKFSYVGVSQLKRPLDHVDSMLKNHCSQPSLSLGHNEKDCDNALCDCTCSSPKESYHVNNAFKCLYSHSCIHSPAHCLSCFSSSHSCSILHQHDDQGYTKAHVTAFDPKHDTMCSNFSFYFNNSTLQPCLITIVMVVLLVVPQVMSLTLMDHQSIRMFPISLIQMI